MVRPRRRGTKRLFAHWKFEGAVIRRTTSIRAKWMVKMVALRLRLERLSDPESAPWLVLCLWDMRPSMMLSKK